MKKLLVVFLSLMLACSAALAQGETVAITYVTAPLNIPSILEREYGIFDEALAPLGAHVAYYELTTGPEQTQALASGDIQFLYAVGATSVILSAANGADIKIISMYSRSPEAFCIFAGDEAIRSPEDLRGKVICGPAGTILHELLAAYLKSAEMTLADVQFVDMTSPNAMAALTGGSCDAALIAGANAYQLEKEGYRVLTTGEGLVEASICVAAAGAYLEENPDVAAAFLEGQAAVLERMDEDYDACIALVADALEMDPQAAAEMAAMYDFSMEIRQSDIEAMQSTERFMLEEGMIDQEVDVSSLIWQA